jgi:hypothetical protein
MPHKLGLWSLQITWRAIDGFDWPASTSSDRQVTVTDGRNRHRWQESLYHSPTHASLQQTSACEGALGKPYLNPHSQPITQVLNVLYHHSLGLKGPEKVQYS